MRPSFVFCDACRVAAGPFKAKQFEVPRRQAVFCPFAAALLFSLAAASQRTRTVHCPHTYVPLSLLLLRHGDAHQWSIVPAADTGTGQSAAPTAATADAHAAATDDGGTTTGRPSGTHPARCGHSVREAGHDGW